MATIYDTNLKSKLDWAFPFHRTGAFPLDRTEIFNSLEDAEKYAKGEEDSRNDSGTAYAGQIITVVNSTEVTPYQIQGDFTLKKLGSDDEDPWMTFDE